MSRQRRITTLASCYNTVRRNLAKMRMTVAANEAEIDRLQNCLIASTLRENQLKAELFSLKRSTSWRITMPLRQAVNLASRLRDLAISATRGTRKANAHPDDFYGRWVVEFAHLTPDDLNTIERHLAAAVFPVVRVAIFLDSSSKHQEVAATLNSLRIQLLPNWQAEVISAESPAWLTKLVSGEPRVVLSDNSAVAKFESVIIIGPGTVLAAQALYFFANAMATAPAVRLIYADEDRLGRNSRHYEPWFKPNYSPELLRHRPYFGGCLALRDPGLSLAALSDPKQLAAVVARVPGDLVLHVPMVLSHSTRPTPALEPAPPRLLAEADLPRVSVIIATRNGLEFLAPCVESILTLTNWPSDLLELIVVDNGSDDPETCAWLKDAADAGTIRLLHDSDLFNFARLNNCAAKMATGALLVLLNNDTLVLCPDWLRLLAGQAMVADVAAVGAKLLYPDGTIQHAGIVLGVQGATAHAHLGLLASAPGYQGLAGVTHEVSAVTGACLAVRTEVYHQLGGLDQHLAVGFNDVMFCLSALEAGYRNICLSEPLLTHLESKSRGRDDTAAKVALCRKEATYTRKRHSLLFKHDPYYNPQLSLDAVYELASPPRGALPWRAYARGAGDKLRVMLLRDMHRPGEGMAVALGEQAAHLVANGFEVFIAGPKRGQESGQESGQEQLIDGSTRIFVETPQDAARLAFQHRIDCVVAYSCSYHDIFRYLGDWPRSIAYDFGDALPGEFMYGGARQLLIADQHLALTFADRTYAISREVQAARAFDGMTVMPFGPTQLRSWTSAAAVDRIPIRESLDLSDQFVVLTICHFGSEDCEGVVGYAALSRMLSDARPDLTDHVTFVLAGRAPANNQILSMAENMQVFARCSEEELLEITVAADCYINLSPRTGYDIDFEKAWAMGMPAFTADTHVHHEQGIATSDRPALAIEWLILQCEASKYGHIPAQVAPPVVSTLDTFATAIRELCQTAL